MLPARTHPPRVLTRLLAALASVALIVAAFASTTTASAATSITPDTGWQQFTTQDGVGGTTATGPFHFENSRLTKVTVTDAYCHGDVFTVLDNGQRLGDTSQIPEELNACPTRFYLSDIARADASMADPTFGHGVFYVGPGSHSLEFVNTAIWNGTDSGSVGFFRLETTSLTLADCMVSGWQNFGTLFPNQGQCLALANSMQHLTDATIGTVAFEASAFGTIARGLTPPETWHTWVGPIFHATTYDTRRTVPMTQADPGREVLTVTAPVSLSATGAGTPSVVTATMTVTPQPHVFSLIPVAQYGSLGNTAWELVDDPTISDPSMVTTWTFRSTAPLTPGVAYDPIVISFDISSNSTFNQVVYNIDKPATATVSATAAGYATGTGSGWYLPQP